MRRVRLAARRALGRCAQACFLVALAILALLWLAPPPPLSGCADAQRRSVPVRLTHNETCPACRATARMYFVANDLVAGSTVMRGHVVAAAINALSGAAERHHRSAHRTAGGSHAPPGGALPHATVVGDWGDGVNLTRHIAEHGPPTTCVIVKQLGHSAAGISRIWREPSPPARRVRPCPPAAPRDNVARPRGSREHGALVVWDIIDYHGTWDIWAMRKYDVDVHVAMSETQKAWLQARLRHTARRCWPSARRTAGHSV